MRKREPSRGNWWGRATSTGTRRLALGLVAVAVIASATTTATLATAAEPAPDSVVAAAVKAAGKPATDQSKTPSIDRGQLVSGPVKVQLPAADAAPARSRGGTSAVRLRTPGVQIAAQTTTDGALRIASIASSPDSPNSVTYNFPGTRLEAAADGSVVVLKDGVGVATIEPAWARDANGRAVDTRYVVNGSQLTQVTDFGSAAFPVVSDPSVRGCLWGVLPAVCIKYNRSETASLNASLAGGISTAAGKMCNMIPSAPIKAACKAVVGAKTADMVSKIKSAQSQKKCLQTKIAYPILPGYITYSVVSC